MGISSTFIKISSTIVVFWGLYCLRYLRLYDTDTGVVFFDVGMGDSILINDEKSRSVLIDSGPDKSSLYKLNMRGPLVDRSIDYVILSHSHADHITGLIYILNEYKIGCLIYNLKDNPISGIEDRLRDIIALKSIPVSYQSNLGCLNNLSNGNFDIYYPPAIRLKVNDQNDESLIVRYSYGDTSFIFTGDAEFNLQDYILGNTNLCSTIQNTKNVLKVPHQGSIDSLNQSFIDCIKPVDAVISVGPNSYGHPHGQVTDTYKGRGIRILRTDIIGDIEYK